MMSEQPNGTFTDDAELGDAFAAFAAAVESATPVFPPDQAAVLERYAEALTGFAEDPASKSANDMMAEMTAPMTSLTGQIANECGLDVVNDN